MSERAALRALADRLGILDGHESALDGRWVPTLESTREALCTAMGYEAGTEAEAEVALARLDEERREGSPPVAPHREQRCLTFDEQLGGEARRFGVWANLYSVRSALSWGFGDFGDLKTLVHEVAAEGGAFVGLNPLHALAPGTEDPSPYRPLSRSFREPLYLSVEAIPELEQCAPARRRIESAGACERIAALRRATHLELSHVRGEKIPTLRMLFGAYETHRLADPGAPRVRAFERYRVEQGDALEDFATFQALVEHFDAPDWRSWPAAFRDPRSPAVEGFRKSSPGSVDFHAWMQFELDRQLGECAEEARRMGLEIGLYTDLALGSDPSGSDAWAHADCFVRGVTLGAPPDGFSRAGQDWSIPPMNPHALRRAAFAPWRGLLAANFRHAGALRIDHALGLRRQFWIPDGHPPHEGAYVMQPEDELLGIIAEESRASNALVIAEDLGTVPEGFSQRLIERGMLTSRVLMFEHDESGFLAASRLPRGCLATVNTHDLPPFEGWWSGADLALRRRCDQIPDDVVLDELRAEREAERASLRQRLVDDGLIEPDGAGEDVELVGAAVTRFLAESPAALVGIGLDDLSGESEPINLPGVAWERHPSWTRRMETSLEALRDAPRRRRIFDAVSDSRRGDRASR